MLTNIHMYFAANVHLFLFFSLPNLQGRSVNCHLTLSHHMFNGDPNLYNCVRNLKPGTKNVKSLAWFPTTLYLDHKYLRNTKRLVTWAGWFGLKVGSHLWTVFINSCEQNLLLQWLCPDNSIRIILLSLLLLLLLFLYNDHHHHHHHHHHLTVP